MMDLPGFVAGEQLYRTETLVVARAQRLCDGVPVVIKYCAGEYPRLKQSASLRNEYEILSLLDAPQVIRAYALERQRNRLYLVLEDVGGAPLSRHFPQRAPELATALEIAIAVADGLAAIHARHIIHKDICPDNILYNPASGAVKLIDFGIATRLAHENQELKSPESLEGTLAYISPEQTGRMNRALDCRTDLYSLGATLYRLLAGAAAFDSGDAIELVHAHIAREPEPLAQRAPGVPQALSDLVGKLMAKELEGRYQSALGVRHDLQHCLVEWRAHGAIAPFALASRDASARFEVPQHIVGREREIAILLEGFERAAGGAAELLLVGGYSGVGKSALVREVHKPIVRRRGYFIAGKHDQFDRGVPYAALAQAFGQMIQMILTEPAGRLAQWRARMQEALAQNGRLVTELVPSLELLIGPQPAVAPLPLGESQSRFNLVFQSFVRVLTQPGHPLVLFLDDMQWADNPTLLLLAALLGQSEIGHLLVVAAYRDNEVGPAHPFMLAVQQLRASRTRVSTISLAPLQPDDAGALVAASLRADVAATAPLSQLLYERTGGNPFFLIQLLYSLHESGLLTQCPASGAWLWQLDSLRRGAVSHNIVDLMASRIERLDERCQEVLKWAACIGSNFDLKMLSVVAQTPYHVTARHIWPAMREGLIQPASADYQAAHRMAPPGETPPTALDEALREEIEGGLFNARYRFLHDRVQQAAYLLIAPGERAAEHLRIGRLLLAACAGDAAAEEEALFELCKHFNTGLALLDDPAERLLLARLNLRAGRRAKAAAANKAAVQHLTAALELLGQQAWECHYALAFELHTGLAECLYLIGDFAAAEALSMAAVCHGRGKLDKTSAYATRVQLFMTGSEFAKALESGVEALTLLGFAVPRDEDEKARACAAALAGIHARLHGVAVASLLDLPAMRDPERQASMELLVPIWCAAYFAGDMRLSALTVYWMVATSLEHGNTDASAMAYTLHGMLLATRDADYRRGFEFGMLGKRLNEERFPNPVYTPKVCNMIANSLNPYFNHLESNLDYYQRSYATGPQVGDIFYSLWAAHLMILVRTMKGDNLAEVKAQSDKYRNFVLDIKDPNIIHAYALQRQIIAALQGRVADEAEGGRAQFFEESNFHVGTLWYGAFKSGMLVVLGQFDAALRVADATEAVIPYDIGLWSTTNHYFYQSLAMLQLHAQAAPAEQARYDAVLARNLAKFDLWARNGPVNFLHRQQLMQAEQARLAGQGGEAERLYELAIAQAAAGRFLHDEALALELAGRHYLALGRSRVARLYLSDAYGAYQRWGALAKTALLEREFGATLLGVAAPAGCAAAACTLGAGGGKLDFASVLKASHALAREIVEEKLLPKLMAILMENAGAERAVLILLRHGSLTVQAEAGTRPSRAPALPLPLADYPDLLHGAVNLVRQTCASLLLDNASEEPRFLNDDYVLRARPKSVLCLPLLNQGRLHGLAYFENNLSSHVFTLARVAVLELLLSQAAISIENASLYQELEQRVHERTRDLRQEVQVRRQAEAALRLRNRAMESTVNAIVITAVVGADNPVEYVNPAFERMTGYSAAEVIGRDMRLLQGGECEQAGVHALREALQERRDGYAVLRNYRKDGQLFWNELYIAPVAGDDGLVSHYVGVMNDITAARDYQRQLEHQANYDTLTDLPNRALLHDRMAQAIAQAQRARERLAVLWIDLDRFKYVNDTFGHAVGDILLRDVAARLKATLRGADTVARVGGDEFVAMVPGLDSPLDAGVIGHELLAAMAQPFFCGALELQVGASIGVSIYPEDGDCADLLLRHADAAMYSVKEAGRNDVQFHTPAMSVHAQQRAALEHALRLALGRGEMALEYQPKVHLESGQMRSVEALLRWHHPEFGVLAPARFVPLAEETGLIVAIGEWVLRTACAQTRAWHAAGHAELTVSVNVSARQFRQSELVGRVAAILAETGLPARYLELEMTESVIMHEGDNVVATLRALKALGVRLSLDDFGTGYSSLSYLKRFPIDTVKIDQSFIREVTSDPGDASLTKAIIAMAHSLGLQTVAEGVETAGQLGFLTRHGCDDVQGYLFSHPVRPEAIDAILNSRAALGPPALPICPLQRTVLLVDDEPNVIGALRRSMRNSGWRILTAGGGAEALELLACNQVDVIVSDHAMPGMSGVEFLRRAREIYPEAVRMLLSGSVDLDVALGAVNDGAVAGLLVKPWNERHLREQIERALQAKGRSAGATQG